MKLRKLFAGVVAAATLVSGMVFGAASANAQDTQVQVDSKTHVVTSDATFKFTVESPDQWSGRTVKYYKLADYVQYKGTGTNAEAAYGVQTVAERDDTVKEALKAAKIEVSGNTDPMAYAMGVNDGLDQSANKPWADKDGNPLTPSKTRQFADALRDALKGAKNDYPTLMETNLTPDAADESGKTMMVSLQAGVYLFVDVAAGSVVKNAQGQTTTNLASQSAPIVLASGTVQGGKITDPLNGNNTVDFKNHVTNITKAPSDVDKTVSTGQTVGYKLSTTLPNITGFAGYSFKLTDTPGVGQRVDVSTKTLKVYLVEGKAKTPLTEGEDKDFTVEIAPEGTERTFDADGTKSFTIDFAGLLKNKDYNTKYYGKTVEVEYSTTVTADVVPVTNNVTVYDNGNPVQDNTELTLGQFSFKKTDAQGNPLGGATFTIVADDGNPNDDIVPVTPNNGKNPNANVVTSDPKTGVVTFKGLADGRYKVTETTIPGGFANYTAEFRVTIQGGKAVEFEGLDKWGLAPSQNSGDNYEVKNVRNVAELPKTGAAGIAMFVALGVVLAGAAAAIYAKSRRAANSLRA